jgi:hypothetical protein
VIGVNDEFLSRSLSGLENLNALYGRETLEISATENVSVKKAIAALGTFTELVRYLNTRRSRGAVLDLSDEAAVQDLVYLMLRPWIADITYENPTDKAANRFVIKDFVSKSGRFVIEAKYVRSESHGKALVSEINDDIEMYRYHPYCEDLVFFIYDPEGYVPDVAALERHLNTNRSYDGKALRCHGIVKP